VPRHAQISTAAPPRDLPALLRVGTADHHAALETRLNLEGRVSDRQHWLAVLERFYGFHVVWERALRQYSALSAFSQPRSRLAHLRRDLTALGRTSAEIERLPECLAAASLTADEARAIGSIYVMEGSTLGGRVISRALAGADWAPDGGLAYFNPYGAETGRMWRSFQAWADERVASGEETAVLAGARGTFGLLQDWLPA